MYPVRSFISKKGIFFVLITLFSHAFNHGYAQSLSDSIIIRNYSSTNYFASSVNYSGRALPSNEILVANDRGLLVYDGSEWKLFPIKNDSKVISLYDENGIIYIGGDDEFGYMSKTKDQDYAYTSLRTQFKDSITLDKFFQVIKVKKDIYFQSYEQIFRWDGKYLHPINLTNAHIFNLNGEIIASQYGTGLFTIKDDVPYILNTTFKFEEDAAFSILKTSKPNIFLICTSDNGIYQLNTDNYSTKPTSSKASVLFKKYGFYYGTTWLDSLYASTTWDGSVVIFNENGDVKKFIDKSIGITGKYLRELFVDNRNKLWITSDVGLSEIYWPEYDPLTKVASFVNKVSINGNLMPLVAVADTLIKEKSNIKLNFSTPGFDKDEVFYSYKLDGLNNNWSDWESANIKEYTQLTGGGYTFYLKSKTSNGLQSPVTSIKINVLTPWYKTPWAFLVYFLLFAGLIFLVVWSRTLRFRIMNKRLETIISTRTKEIVEKSNELSAANESLKVKNNELDNFVYRSSHDLIAPLKSLKGLIHIAKSENPGENHLEYLKHMENSVLKLEDFIESILDFTTNIKTGISKVDVNIDELLNDITYELKYYDNAGGITLKKSIEKSVFQSDPKRLKIVLSNLMINSVKYHNLRQENPFVEVKTYENNGYSIIEVKDNGQGIKPEYLDNIFNMFFRASSNSEGSGLGLYIVKDTITKLGGNISVDSIYGEGTTFTIKLNN